MGLESEVCIVAGHQVFGPNLSQAVLQWMENQQIQERPLDNTVPVINAFAGIRSIYYSSNFVLGLVETTNSDLMHDASCTVIQCVLPLRESPLFLIVKAQLLLWVSARTYCNIRSCGPYHTIIWFAVLFLLEFGFVPPQVVQFISKVTWI